ncbi:MAG: rhodanese-like domain-containing protein [Candidatus Kapabacteria bacterium]|nr:rhodanese-like domain-containing protein [Candidatus Kapabacteria bacterium]
MTIVDVRTPEEFMGGNVVGSINIPIAEIENRINEIETFKQPLYLCCASGGRSGIATEFLMSKGIDCKNVGSWMQANALTKKEIE